MSDHTLKRLTKNFFRRKGQPIALKRLTAKVGSVASTSEASAWQNVRICANRSHGCECSQTAEQTDVNIYFISNRSHICECSYIAELFVYIKTVCIFSNIFDIFLKKFLFESGI